MTMDTNIAVAIIRAVGAVVVAVISATVPTLFQRVRKTNARVDKNENILRNLIAYKPGAVAYGLLINIKNRDGVSYDEQNDDKKRCLNLLLDDGYLKPAPGIAYVRFCSEYNGRKLYEIASLTPVAEQLIEYRQILSKSGDE
jgi:hypothetical protein